MDKLAVVTTKRSIVSPKSDIVTRLTDKSSVNISLDSDLFLILKNQTE
jgi:hypothetical protein